MIHKPTSRREFGKWILKGGILVPFAGPIIRARAQVVHGPVAPVALAAGAPSCNTLRDSITHASPTDVGLIGISGIQKRSVRFTATASYTGCKFILTLDKVGTPSGYTLIASVWDVLGAGGRPGSQIGGDSSSNDANTLAAGSPTEMTFINGTSSIVNGTDYNLVLSIGTTNDSNYVRWWNQTYNAATCSYSGGSWNAPDGTPRDLLMRIYSA